VFHKKNIYLLHLVKKKPLMFLKEKEITVWLIAKQSLPLACFFKNYEKNVEFIVI